MRAFLLAPLAAAALAMGGLAQAAEVESGPDVGSGTGAFNVKDITGPNKGRSLCYR